MWTHGPRSALKGDVLKENAMTPSCPAFQWFPLQVATIAKLSMTLQSTTTSAKHNSDPGPRTCMFNLKAEGSPDYMSWTQLWSTNAESHWKAAVMWAAGLIMISAIGWTSSRSIATHARPPKRISNIDTTRHLGADQCLTTELAS